MTLALAFLGVVGVAFGVFLPAGLSWGGAFLGFIYAFVVGYAIGRVVGTVYNKLAH